MTFTRRVAFVFTLILGLSACGGGGGSSGGQATVRAINVTTDLASVDLASGGTTLFSGLGSMPTDAATLDAGTYAMSVNASGATSSVLLGSYTLSKDTAYLAVVWGRQNALRLSTLADNQDDSTIASGNGRLRVGPESAGAFPGPACYRNGGPATVTDASWRWWSAGQTRSTYRCVARC